LHEVREHTQTREEVAKSRATQRYKTHAREQLFNKGDLVSQKIGEVQKDKHEGKLTSNWEDPYRVVDSLQNGTYKLKN